jgi:hypothetical protein
MIVIYNPHVDDFLATPPHFKFLKRRALKKYGFFLDGLIKQDRALNIIIDYTISIFIPHKIFNILPEFIRKIIVDFEFKQWVKINKFENCINLIDAGQDLSNDILLAFSYKAATGNFLQRLALFNRFKKTIFHLSHYFVNTKIKANNLKLIKNLYLAGDSDITENPYFQHFFFWYNKPFLVLPFAVSPRFQIRKKFELRENKCIATGSFHDLTKEYPQENYLDFISVTGSTTYHPIRKEIFINRNVNAEKISCYIAPYRDYIKTSKFARLIKHFSISQKKYFAVDIVEAYNDHKFAIVGEELSGFPALGAFEAIACGCILIAVPSCYRGLGLEPYKHFVPYDGSLEELLLNISQIESIQFDFEKYFDNMKFIQSNFNPEVQFQKWFSRILDA